MPHVSSREIVFTGDPITSDSDFERRILDDYAIADATRRVIIEEVLTDLFSEDTKNSSLMFINCSMTFLRGETQTSFSLYRQLFNEYGYGTEASMRHLREYAQSLHRSGKKEEALVALHNGIIASSIEDMDVYQLYLEYLNSSALNKAKALNLNVKMLSKWQVETTYWTKLWVQLANIFSSIDFNDIYQGPEITYEAINELNITKYLHLFTMGLQLFPRSLNMIHATATTHVLYDFANRVHDKHHYLCARHLLERYINLYQLCRNDIRVNHRVCESQDEGQFERVESELSELTDLIHNTFDIPIHLQSYDCHPFINTEGYIHMIRDTNANASDSLFNLEDIDFDTRHHGLWLNIGCSSEENCPNVGWTVIDGLMNALPVHIASEVNDLSVIDSGSVEKVYSSHTLEHLSPTFGRKTHKKAYSELCDTLAEWNRVLRHNGEILISVPDFGTIIALHSRFSSTLTACDKRFLQSMVFGGQEDAYDVHKIGFDFEFLRDILIDFGFCDIERVGGFGLFTDHSTTNFTITGDQQEKVSLSINVKAKKCKGPEIYIAGEVNENMFKCACYNCF